MIIGPWIAWTMALGPAVAVAPFAAFTLYVYLRLKIKGTQVEAECEAYRLTGDKRCLQYRYIDRSEQSHVRLVHLSFPVPHAQKGRPLEVVYDPARPSRSRSRHELNRWIPWAGFTVGTYLFVQLVLGVIGGAFLYVGMFDR